MTDEPSEVTVTYKSGRHPTKGWDVMEVTQSRGGRTLKSVVIARDGAGTIVRRTDVLLDRWEIVQDPEKLRGYRDWFDNRDRLLLEQSEGATESTPEGA